MLFQKIYFSGKKCVIAATDSNGEDVYTPMYVHILAYLLSICQSAFSPKHVSPKKARTKEPSTPSQSKKSVFIYFYFVLYLFYLIYL